MKKEDGLTINAKEEYVLNGVSKTVATTNDRFLLLTARNESPYDINVKYSYGGKTSPSIVVPTGYSIIPVLLAKTTFNSMDLTVYNQSLVIKAVLCLRLNGPVSKYDDREGYTEILAGVITELDQNQIGFNHDGIQRVRYIQLLAKGDSGEARSLILFGIKEDNHNPLHPYLVGLNCAGEKDCIYMGKNGYNMARVEDNSGNIEVAQGADVTVINLSPGNNKKLTIRIGLL